MMQKQDYFDAARLIEVESLLAAKDYYFNQIFDSFEKAFLAFEEVKASMDDYARLSANTDRNNLYVQCLANGTIMEFITEQLRLITERNKTNAESMECHSK